ncbi:glutathione peroxidase [Levilactobacillus bambusae]|uniref:Glutathione peroxidase n=1 Tax=Levilactobacillus bambusae TaxID=2024736 RepID=A0A2V1MZC8_9LACO|nr:glutathione peroxidase [Levilactobacillus bambusae]PWF99485.1 glutathione peroxidase [Levilactobacillus bambusae]
MANIYQFQETEMNGQPIDFETYRGKVLLLMNTASKCGFAPQLKGFEAMYQEYHNQGLELLGLPSNQFHQELSTDEETEDYCQVHYGVTFPMTKRIRVNGAGEDPLFAYLKAQTNSGRIKWNFTKFLINRDGTLIKRFPPRTTPEKMLPDVIAALNESNEG